MLLVLLACAPKIDAVAPAGRSAAPVVETGRLPTPYTATQLHDAFPAGAELRYRITEGSGEVVVEHMRFTEPTLETVVVHTAVYREDGTLLADEGAETHRWEELRDHASFPVAGTRRSEASVTVPAGTFSTLRYELTEEGEGGVPLSVTYDFDPARAGPPVRMVVETGGVRVMTMELLSRSP